MPRKLQGDRFQTKRDDVYPAIEQHEAELASDLKVSAGEPLKIDDESRQPRTVEEMIKESDWLKSFL